MIKTFDYIIGLLTRIRPIMFKSLLITITFLFLAVLNSFAISNTNDVKEIGIDEKLGSGIPLDIEFLDQDGNVTTLKNHFNGNRPVVINLVYFSCPRICTFALDGVLEVLNNLSSLKLGKDFKVLTVSFNSEEDHKLAKSKSVKYLKGLKEKISTNSDWVFLTGNQENILELTKSVGFKFKKDGEEFAHPSSLIVLTPEGMISRYLHGIQHDTKNFKLALLEASKGEIGSSKVLNKVLLFCYQFDPVGKKYALKALNIVKAGGMVTLLALTGFLTFMWKREK